MCSMVSVTKNHQPFKVSSTVAKNSWVEHQEKATEFQEGGAEAAENPSQGQSGPALELRVPFCNCKIPKVFTAWDS